ncbi:MAG: ATP-dependent helicase [Prevotella sp.]|jgi:DNA helicase-2/ATP-dependent DNA helicase PcrA
MDNKDEFLEQLNDRQREAVEYCDGPQLIIAGAGSGKTRVLTYKIAYLLQTGLQPWHILALTFTNKAANEMKERIAKLVGPELAGNLRMGTFHSIFSRILRVEATKLDYTSDYTIYDEADSRSVIKKIVKEKGLDEKVYKPATVHGIISKAKNKLVTADNYVNDMQRLDWDRNRNMPEIGNIYVAYQQRLKKSNCMDFDDLLVLTFQLLSNNEEARQKYEKLFEFVLVDEYQDTNYVQRRILELLTKNRRKLCVVGDDYQSIYAFRGANIDNILTFQKSYPEAKLFKLEQNYRSTQLIVQAANSLMTHNRNQIPKQLYSKNEVGEKICVLENASDKTEAKTVCREIKTLQKKEGCRWSDFAILYRTNAQSRLFEEEMRTASVGLGDKYRIYGGLSFYQRKEIKDIIAYMRLVVNPHDEEAFYRVVNYPARGIGNTTLQRLAEAARNYGVSAWTLLDNPADYEIGVNKGTLSKLLAFHQLISGFIALRHRQDVESLVRKIILDTGISEELLHDKTPEGQDRKENVDELMSAIASFVQAQQEDGQSDHFYIDDYLATVSLMTDLDSDDASDDKISLMTIHAAKGLEFKTVFIVGVEENMFPSPLSMNSAREIEEERRLFYVAITRAERHCYISWAHQRWHYGKPDLQVRPSMFLKDIDADYLEVRREGYKNPVPHSSWLEDSWNEEPTFGESWGGGFRRRPDRQMQESRSVERYSSSPLHKESDKSSLSSGNWKRVGRSGGVPVAKSQNASLQSSAIGGLSVGMVIEHQRFGRGTVMAIEGTGENSKATIDFNDVGTKQLLLKFARFVIVR